MEVKRMSAYTNPWLKKKLSLSLLSSLKAGTTRLRIKGMVKRAPTPRLYFTPIFSRR
jgi:hypothetical protein